jgi:Ca-activated chloride channel homolog
MSLGAPSMLWTWSAVPLLLGLFLFSLWRRRVLLSRFQGPITAGRMAERPSTRRRLARNGLFLCAVSLLILALARPQWGVRVEPVTRHGVDILVALDVSLSMRAEDVTPSRLDVARAFIADLARRLEGNRIGLIGFAGTAFVHCPLTLDTSALLLFLDGLDPGSAPDPGSSLAEAIDVGLEALPAAAQGDRVLVLVSDGEDLSGGEEAAARRASSRGVAVYAVGVGTPAGGPIPLRAPSGEIVEYKKDAAGRVVTSRQDAARLARVAEAGGGKYLNASAALDASARLAAEIGRLEKAALTDRMVTTRQERFQIPLAAAFLLLLLEAGLPETRPARRES